MIKRSPTIWLLAAAVAFLSGCQTTPQIYYWGNYEAIAYLAYTKPEKATLKLQLEKLKEDVTKSAKFAANPGLHAQLGYVYYQLGRVDEAVAEFTIEKELFPEATTFMDRMIEQAKGGKNPA